MQTMISVQLNNNQTIKPKKVFDLEDRTLEYSKKAITFAKTLKLEIINTQLIPQFIRYSASIGANYREANNALGKKDFLMRIRICRKEAKEAKYWLELLFHANTNYDTTIHLLMKEVSEFIKIFSAIIEKSIVNNQ